MQHNSGKKEGVQSVREAGPGRGQAAVEFVAYAAFFLMFFALSTSYFLNQQSSDMRLRENQLAQEIGSQYADYINFAVAAGDGFEGNFTVPRNMIGKPYDVSFASDGFIYMNWSTPSGEAVYVYQTNAKPFYTGGPVSRVKYRTGLTPPFYYIDIDETYGKIKLTNSKGAITISQP